VLKASPTYGCGAWGEGCDRRAGLRYPWTNYRANFERREEVIEVESYCNLSVRESLPIRLRLKGNAMLRKEDTTINIYKI
jgi:hypothetical protein